MDDIIWNPPFEVNNPDLRFMVKCGSWRINKVKNNCIIVFYVFRCRKCVTGELWHVLMRDMDDSTILPLAEEDAPPPADEAVSVGAPAEDEDNDDDDVDPDNPMWKLFLLAKNLILPSSE